MLSAERERAYLGILERGILNVRTLLARADVEQAIVEANHIHNIPSLLSDEAAHSEGEYWEIARAGYLRDSKPGWPSAFRLMWETLDPANAAAPVSARAS
jgi:hypothetical protein